MALHGGAAIALVSTCCGMVQNRRYKSYRQDNRVEQVFGLYLERLSNHKSLLCFPQLRNSVESCRDGA